MRSLLLGLCLVVVGACGGRKAELVTSGNNPDSVNGPGSEEPEPDCCCLGVDNQRNATTHQACQRDHGTCEAELSACFSMEHLDGEDGHGS